MMLGPTLTLGNAGGVPAFNAVVVSGAGTAEANGTYLLAATVNGRPSYELTQGVDSIRIIWDGVWQLKKGAAFYYEDFDYTDVPYPWKVVTWYSMAAADPAPTVTGARV